MININAVAVVLRRDFIVETSCKKEFITASNKRGFDFEKHIYVQAGYINMSVVNTE